MGLGEGAALAASACWAAASLLYVRVPVSAWGMNFSKNVLATVLLLVHLGVLAIVSSQPMFSADTHAWIWLGVSGVIGIVLGDTFYFRSVQILGPHRALLLTTTAPVFAAFFGWAMLGEKLEAIALLGITLTLLGVARVISTQQSKEETPDLFPGTVKQGVVYALLGAICQALGGVASRLGMGSDGTEHCSAEEAAFIRLAVSAVGAGIVVAVAKEFRSTFQKIKRRDVLSRFCPAVVMGTWLGIWLSQVAYQNSKVAVATTLLTTSSLFVIPLMRVFSGVRVSGAAIVGTSIAVLGIALLAL